VAERRTDIEVTMTPELWQRLKPLYEAAMETPEEQRAQFVAEACKDDSELREHLEALLAAPNESTGLFDAPLVNLRDLFPSKQRALTDGDLVLGRFKIVRILGCGGMGEVFEADDLELNDRVALKVIRPEIASDPHVAARFKREILLGKRVSHPNVCRIHDLGSAKSNSGVETLFLTMEFLNGEILSSRIKRGPMSAAESLPLIENMADGLAAAHLAGIVHRDFKSANVMLVHSSDQVHAVITDFGLARALRETTEATALTDPGAIAGTVNYMAPEQIRGEEVTPAADVYSFGVVIYEMVTGRVPFVADSSLGIALQHLKEPPPSPRKFAPDLDASWEAAILCCLRKAPEDRFSSAAQITAALRSGSVRSMPKVPKRHRLLAALLTLSIAALAAFLLWAWISGVITSHLIPSEERVGVLEFENIGGDPANQAFCDGLMEILSSQLTELEQFHGSLSVVPASDIRKEKVTSAREARRDFGVTLVITGSIQRSSSGMRLTINVVDARQLKQLRSHSMFIPEADGISMQEGVISQVTELLDIQLRPDAQRRLAEGRTSVPGAYESYLQGAGYLLDGAAAADDAIKQFQQALRLDPDYALAHAGLGRAYWSKYSATKDRSWIDQAWRECTRSIELGPQLSDPHVTLALLNSGTGHYEEAIREARQAINIDPYNDRAYSELARALEASNKTDAAEATLKKAISLRPNYWYNYARLGSFYGQRARYKEAEAPFMRVIDLAPENPKGYTNLAAIYHLEGRESDAEKMLKKSIQLEPTTIAYSNLATVYFFEGRYADAVPIMEKLVSGTNGVCGSTQEYMQCGNLGDDYRWTPGNAEKATLAYQKAIELAQEAVNVNPRDATAWSSMALYRAKLGQSREALQTMEKALAFAPDDDTVLFDAAVVCELAGEQARALKFIQSAVKGGYSLNEIAAEPELRKLRENPQYQAAVSFKHGR
jgi:serine/threonine protein kinase/tetratricopeptide (TPR) repeat protein